MDNINLAINNATYDPTVYHIDGFDVRCGLTNSTDPGFVLCVSCSEIVFGDAKSYPGIVINANDVKQLITSCGYTYTLGFIGFAIAHEIGHMKYWDVFGTSKDGKLVTDPSIEIYADHYAITRMHVTMGAYRGYMEQFNNMAKEANKRTIKKWLVRSILNWYNSILINTRIKNTIKETDFSGITEVLVSLPDPYNGIVQSIIKKCI